MSSMVRSSTFGGQARNSKVHDDFAMFSSHRRYVFCPLTVIYLTSCPTMRLQTSAENALELHGHELEPNQPMNVFISKPEWKKERTDQDANEREVYVAGLSKFTTQADLEKLFKTVCPFSWVLCTISYSTLSTGR